MSEDQTTKSADEVAHNLLLGSLEMFGQGGDAVTLEMDDAHWGIWLEIHDQNGAQIIKTLIGEEHLEALQDWLARRQGRRGQAGA